MSKKMTNCKVCGAEIAKGATCPHCGAKSKKGCLPIILAVLAIMVVIGMIGGGSEDEPAKNAEAAPTTKEEVEAITYTSYTVKQLVDDLNNNALKAEQTYQNQYVELTGRLSVIDSDGAYISLWSTGSDFSFYSVLCYMQNDAQVEQVMDMAVGDTITVRGQITDIGEVLGYMLDIDEFVIE